MKYVRVNHQDHAHWGRVEGGAVRLIAGAPWEDERPTGPSLALEGIKLLPPATPSKIIAIGRNYAEHAAEFGNEVPQEPMIFSKVVSSLIGPGQAVRLPGWVGRVDHEAELGVLIGRKVRKVSPDEARAAVFGVTCLNDVSARVIQKKDIRFTRAKGFDTFCPLGPWLVTGLDYEDLAVRALVNGQVKQNSRTSKMIFSVPHLISFISQAMTLMPGDMIATGTPEGVSPLSPGDVVTVEIEGIGRLENPVVADE